MIQEKTRGNLTSEEAKVLSNAVSNLQMAYVEVARESGEARPESAHRGEGAPQTEAAHAQTQAEQLPAGTPEPSAPIASTEPESESRKKFTKSYGP
jgi:hypothetical protein